MSLKIYPKGHGPKIFERERLNVFHLLMLRLSQSSLISPLSMVNLLDKMLWPTLKFGGKMVWNFVCLEVRTCLLFKAIHSIVLLNIKEWGGGVGQIDTEC